MSVFLLDVNVLIALGWGGHPDHNRVLQLVRTIRRAGLGDLSDHPGRLRQDRIESRIFSARRLAPRGFAIVGG